MAVPGSVVGVGKLITPGGQQGVKGDPGSPANFTSQRVIFDDFLGIATGPTLANNTFIGLLPWLVNLSGTGAAVSFNDSYATSAAGAFGCLQVNTGTVANGYGAITSALLYPGKGPLEMDFRVLAPAAPTLTQNYQLQMGIQDAAATHYIQLTAQYSSGSVVSGGVANGGTASNTATTAFTAGSFNRFQILVNAAWTSVSFYLNGTLIGSAVTANIPVATPMYIFFLLIKTAGTTAVSAVIDQLYLNYQYAS